jgi:hypothetical protein
LPTQQIKVRQFSGRKLVILHSVVERFCHRLAASQQWDEQLKLNPIVLRYVTKARTIKDSASRCMAVSNALIFLTRMNVDDTLTRSLEEVITSSLVAIDNQNQRLQTGFRAVALLADYKRERARALLSWLESERLGFDDTSRDTFLQSVRLAIRSYSGLLPTKLESGKDLDRLSRMIEEVGSRELRLRLWLDLAIRCVRTRRTDDGKQIVQTRIQPLLEYLKHKFDFECLEALSYGAPALYIVNPIGTIGQLDNLPSHWRRSAYQRLCRYKKTGVPPGEPYLTGVSPYHMDFDTCVELLKLSEGLEDDAAIYANVEDVAKSSLWKHNRSKFSQAQRTTLGEAIRTLVKKTLPSPIGIQHEGYAILCEAYALRLLREKNADWEPLVDRVQTIGNISDKALVLAYLAQTLHNGLSEERLRLLRSSYDLCLQISSMSDRMSHLRSLASVAMEVDKSFARKLVHEIADNLRASKYPAPDTDEIRNLVDLAYQLDPDMASSLASTLDPDEGRQEARREVEYQRLKAELREPSHSTIEDTQLHTREFARACWDLLGQLNAQRVPPRDVESTMTFLRRTRDASLEDAYPIISLVIENAIIRRGESTEAKQFLREMFEAALGACELARVVVARTSGRAVVQALSMNAESSESILIAAGDRPRAMEFITQWISKNADNHIYICDPFFGVRDLEILQTVRDVKPEVSVSVITSRRQQDQDKVSLPYEDFYTDYWRQNFSEADPPETEFVVVGSAAGELPIHDRWILSNGRGLRLGTSLNGIGVSKDSEISVLNSNEVEDRERETRMYLERQKREHLGHKISYTFFSLPT